MSGAAHQPGAELLIPADTPVHRMPPAPKVVATVVFVLAVAFTPARTYWPFLWYGTLLTVAIVLAQLPVATLAKRMMVEIPFLLFVLLLPFVGGSPKVDVLGVGLSQVGLYAAATIALKASFGLLATGVLAATTTLPDVISGLEQLRLPRILTTVASFMVRYTEVLLDELNRLRTARACRCGNPRWLWQARDIAACLSALFIRSLERGERVHVAMLSRGFTGTMPAGLSPAPASRRSWAGASVLPTLAIAGSVAARLVAW